MRALGIDLGSKRIGVAVSDSGGTIASPVEVLTRSGDVEADHRRIVELAAEWEAERIVVGLPISLDGTLGPAASATLVEVEALASVAAPTPVETYDERLTTVTAERYLREMGRSGKQRRTVVDKLAAAVLLQAWLESPSAGDAAPTSR